MKLKVKMAKDYANKQFYDSADKDFLAGFEAAKKLAIELIEAPAWIMIRDMRNLGDQDVEE